MAEHRPESCVAAPICEEEEERRKKAEKKEEEERTVMPKNMVRLIWKYEVVPESLAMMI